MPCLVWETPMLGHFTACEFSHNETRVFRPGPHPLEVSINASDRSE
jgi:hypothetical protein